MFDDWGFDHPQHRLRAQWYLRVWSAQAVTEAIWTQVQGMLWINFTEGKTREFLYNRVWPLVDRVAQGQAGNYIPALLSRQSGSAGSVSDEERRRYRKAWEEAFGVLDDSMHQRIRHLAERMRARR